MESQSVEQLVFEGMVDRPVLVKSSAAMLQRLIDFNISTGVERLKMHHGDVPDEIIPDIDPTDDATHGRQQLSLLHGFHNQHQYLPQIISEPTTKQSSWRGCDRESLIHRLGPMTRRMVVNNRRCSMVSTNSTSICHRSSASRPRSMSFWRGCDREPLIHRSGPMMISCGWSAACDGRRPMSPFMFAVTADSVCRRCTTPVRKTA